MLARDPRGAPYDLVPGPARFPACLTLVSRRFEMLNALCRARRSAVITGALLVALLESAAAQGRERPWQVSSRLRGALEYDDNPFLLDTAHIRKLGQPTAADSASGRFTD